MAFNATFNNISVIRKILNQGFLLVKLKSSLWKFYGLEHDLVNRYGISVSQMTRYVPPVISTSQSFPRSWLITRFVTRVRRVPLVEQELLTLPEHQSSTLVFSGVRVAQSFVFCVMFCKFLFFLLAIVLSVLRYTDYDLWYLPTFLTKRNLNKDGQQFHQHHQNEQPTQTIEQ